MSYQKYLTSKKLANGRVVPAPQIKYFLVSDKLYLTNGDDTNSLYLNLSSRELPLGTDQKVTGTIHKSYKNSCVDNLWYNKSMPAICKICLSPYRDEMMRAFKAGFPRRMLYEKYKPLVWMKSPIQENSFYQALYKHMKHKLPGAFIVQVKNTVGQDTQGIAKMMTQLYAKKVETMTPDDVTTKDYIGVNKLVIDEQKLSLDKNSQMLEFAKIFGIPDVEPIVVIEGEEHAELGPPKDQGDQQESPQ